MRQLMALVLLALAASPATASWETIQQTGLAGRWQYDCTRPANPDTNFAHIYFADAAGRARQRVERGTAADERALEDVSVPSPGLVHFKAVHDDARWTKFLIEILDGGRRQRALQMTIRGDRYVVRDGIVVPSGKPSPFFEKCGGPNA